MECGGLVLIGQFLKSKVKSLKQKNKNFQPTKGERLWEQSFDLLGQRQFFSFFLNLHSEFWHLPLPQF
jgi:hypothetical protein